METVKLGVQGMTCGGCVASVTRVLKATPGVSDAQVTLQPGSATITFDPAKVQVRELKAAIAGAGFDVAA
jgi:copper chaperone